MRRFILALSLLAGIAAAAHAADDGPLVLNAAQIRTGGIKSAVLQPAQQTAAVTGFGQVMDPGTLAAASAKLAFARAGVTQAWARLTLARAQESRAARLFRAERNISKAKYQTAQAAAQVAAAALEVAQARLRAVRAQVLADWGPALAHALASAATPVPELADAASCLVQVTLPLGVTLAAAPKQAEGEPAAGRSLALTLIGPSPKTPAGSGPSYFYRGSAPACPPAGTTVATRLPDGPARRGVVVPATAVVWRGDLPLLFRDDGPRGFTPVALAGAVPFADGYFVPASADRLLRPGQKIVVRGAALLLSQIELGTPAKPKSGGNDDD